jgi:ribosomal protein RSM22 (predicted rRNA methylase)
MLAIISLRSQKKLVHQQRLISHGSDKNRNQIEPDDYYEKVVKGTIQLPTNLKIRIQNALKNFSKQQLQKEGGELSQMLRKRTVSSHKEVDTKSSESPLEKEKTIAYNKGKALAYIAHRMPGVYACTKRVFQEISVQMPSWEPRTMLDFGSGPGTAIWSASESWDSLKRAQQPINRFSERNDSSSRSPRRLSKGVEEVQSPRILAIEPSSAMLDVAQEFILKDFQGVEWRRFLASSANTTDNINMNVNNDIHTNQPAPPSDDSSVSSKSTKKARGKAGLVELAGWPEGVYDLVVGSYVFSEMNAGDWPATLVSLWDQVAAGGVLVIVEPGTPVTWDVVRQLRTLILSQTHPEQLFEPHILAPCPHSFSCPMVGTSDWCHYSQRVERMALTKGTKLGSSINWEDEKFAYLAVVKQPVLHRFASPTQRRWVTPLLPYQPHYRRLVKATLRRGSHVILDACVPTGKLERVVIPKSQGSALYKAARSAKWGDKWLYNDKNNATISGTEEQLTAEEEELN